jgi:hypothetical protein
MKKTVKKVAAAEVRRVPAAFDDVFERIKAIWPRGGE